MTTVARAQVERAGIAIRAVCTAGTAVGNRLDAARAVLTRVVGAGISVVTFEVQDTAIVDWRDIALASDTLGRLAHAYRTIIGCVAAGWITRWHI